MIEITISGVSIPEVADKLLAMGHSLTAVRIDYSTQNGATIEPVEVTADVPAEAEKPKAKRTAKKAEPQAAPVTVVEDAPEETVDAGTGEVVEAVPALETVTAAVLSAVERVGRDKVVAILAQFGVNRASEVPAAQRAELLQMVKDA